MKHCPACNFNFPDFHKVCDFDGTALVADPEPLALVKPHRHHVFGVPLQSPVFWVAFWLCRVSNTFLFALYDARSRSTLAVNAQPSPASRPSIESVTPAAQTPASAPELSNQRALSTRAGSRNVSRLAASPASQRRHTKTARTPARKQNTSVANRPNRDYSPARPIPSASASRECVKTENANSKQQQSEPARRRNLSPEERASEITRRSDPQKTPAAKERKLTSMLKTTWHVLKKPFSF
jgi:hypothetical protein